jgi:hypothetical protein
MARPPGSGGAPATDQTRIGLRFVMATRKKRWSQRVTEQSDALTLDAGVFARDDPRSIARSLKRSAERSRRRKAEPYRSAMSMLTFYLNRAGKNLPAGRRRKVEAAKQELRRLYGKEEAAGTRAQNKKAAGKKARSKKTGSQKASTKRTGSKKASGTRKRAARRKSRSTISARG